MQRSVSGSLSALIGPRGWRSVAGPAAFALVALLLLIFDHFQERVSGAAFWLTVGLIACVFSWLVETARKQSGALQREHQRAMNDETTRLGNAAKLKVDIATALAANQRRALVLVELDGVQAYYDSFGYGPGDLLIRNFAKRLSENVAPLQGVAYRIEANRFATLIPAELSQQGEAVLVATGLLQEVAEEFSVGGSYGEAMLADDADSPEGVLQVAGQRLAARKQRQRGSARRQAYAVLMEALGARHPKRRDNMHAVAYRAIALGRRLGMERDEIDDISLAAGLQDIGLLAVPEAILDKSTPLEEAEVAVLRCHPAAGERIIAAAPELAKVASIVGAASERYDGSGIRGLAADQIPIGARIIAVAAAYTAMTSARPYSPAVSTEEALAELRRCAATQFDPRVVEALAEELSEESAPVDPAQTLVPTQ